MNKLYYIVPHYDRDEATHFSYAVDLAMRLKGIFEIYLLIESGSYVGDGVVAKARVMRFRFLPLRVIELVIRIASARRAGFKDFYVHYSFAAALSAILVTGFSGGRVFYWNCGEPWKFKRGVLREALERYVYKHVSFLVTGTDGLKRAYSRNYGIDESKIKILPNWIESPPSFASQEHIADLRDALHLPAGKHVALFVHRLSRRKGAHSLPSLAEFLKNEETILVVVGDGPLKEPLARETNERSLGEYVRFVGGVPQRTINLYYGLADIFILPSEEEGFPHVLLESMAYGVPYVAFDVGGVREITPPELQPFIVPEGRIDLMCERLGFLLRGKNIENLSKTIRIWAGRFSADNAIKVFTHIINEP